MNASSLPPPPSSRAATPPRAASLAAKVLRNGSVRVGGGLLALLLVAALAAPWLGTIDPTAIDPGSGDLLPGTRATFNDLAGNSFEHLFIMGSDSLGRDVWSRVLYGTRVSLAVGAASAALALLAGVLMRIMDGMMAIPGILFAIALVAVWRANLTTVIIAICVPEIPRVARLVRSVVLSMRDEAYVEAAVALNTPAWKILWRHILPGTIAPLTVQGTYVCAMAILVEAVLSFLGVGLPPELPTWGNIMAEGRLHFNAYPHNVLFPGLFLAIAVFSVNLLGDGLRDTLDPRFNQRGR